MGSVEAVLAERLLSLSLEQKVRLLTGADFWSLHPEPDVGLRRLVLSDGPAGVRGERCLVERPTRWLAGFTGVDAGPGEETTSEVAIPARVGWSSQDLPICADVAIPATAGISPLGPG